MALPTILPVIIMDRTDTLIMLDRTGGTGTGPVAIGVNPLVVPLIFAPWINRARNHRRLSSSGTENLGKDFPSLPAKPAASIQASLSDNSPGRRNGRSSPRATNSGSVKA